MFRNVLLALLSLALAGGGGAATAWLALRSPPREHAGWTPADAVRAPSLQDPLSLQRPFALALGLDEGIAFTATLDAEGKPLSAACDYRVAGRFPPSRLWTLIAVDRRDPSRSAALHALETLRGPDGSDAVAVSRHPSPGNWLAVAASGEFALTLSLYGGMLNDGTGFTDVVLPRIETVRCDE